MESKAGFFRGSSNQFEEFHFFFGWDDHPQYKELIDAGTHQQWPKSAPGNICCIWGMPVVTQLL